MKHAYNIIDKEIKDTIFREATLYPSMLAIAFDKNSNPPYLDDFQIVKNGAVGYIPRFINENINYEAGETVAHFTGYVTHKVMQHTLQINEKLHIFDPYFIGFLGHSCDPNVKLDMNTFSVIALKPITAGDYLYMDYAQTEDYLFKCFQCSCGAENCRGYITGRLQESNQNTGE